MSCEIHLRERKSPDFEEYTQQGPRKYEALTNEMQFMEDVVKSKLNRQPENISISLAQKLNEPEIEEINKLAVLQHQIPGALKDAQREINALIEFINLMDLIVESPARNVPQAIYHVQNVEGHRSLDKDHIAFENWEGELDDKEIHEEKKIEVSNVASLQHTFLTSLQKYFPVENIKTNSRYKPQEPLQLHDKLCFDCSFQKKGSSFTPNWSRVPVTNKCGLFRLTIPQGYHEFSLRMNMIIGEETISMFIPINAVGSTLKASDCGLPESVQSRLKECGEFLDEVRHGCWCKELFNIMRDEQKKWPSSEIVTAGSLTVDTVNLLIPICKDLARGIWPNGGARPSINVQFRLEMKPRYGSYKPEDVIGSYPPEEYTSIMETDKEIEALYKPPPATDLSTSHVGQICGKIQENLTLGMREWMNHHFNTRVTIDPLKPFSSTLSQRNCNEVFAEAGSLLKTCIGSIQQTLLREYVSNRFKTNPWRWLPIEIIPEESSCQSVIHFDDCKGISQRICLKNDLITLNFDEIQSVDELESEHEKCLSGFWYSTSFVPPSFVF
eukprot:TRINITY_DN11242_c0_g1_i1.p1 TRINITY_DN11242_c0_g1~~TRINITY_DN11242_c0_g1_i1.p1  ORF type:complete len:555 (+),score=139.20 TRINITY_DN11242_c0_g1_i1:90-1754(+)